MSGFFRLWVEFGNAEMQTPSDVAKSLRRLADRLERGVGCPDGGKIVDANGNMVGEWDTERNPSRRDGSW